MVAIEKSGTSTIVAIIAIIAVVVLAVFLPRNIVVTVPQILQENGVSVQGSSVVTTAPDKAELYVKVVTLEAAAIASQQKNSEQTNKIIKALKAEGIAEADIETQSYYLQQKQSWDEEKNKYVVEGYETVHTLKASTKSLEKVGKLIDVAVNAGANAVDSVVFTLSKEKQARTSSQALSEASADAKQRAETLAKSLGVSLGKVVSVSESNVYYAPYNYYPSLAKAEAVDATPIQPKNVELSASVSVVFELK